MVALDAWDSFYVIVGSSAGALIGLQFVVMTLIAERPRLRVAEAGAAFSTPNIVHFGAVLLLSALLRVPWQATAHAAAFCGFLGICGAACSLVVVRRMRRQSAYRPDFEDWLCHALLPLLAYAGLAVSAYWLMGQMREALFGIAAAALLLLFCAIHNAWDAVTYNVFVSRSNKEVS